jgi:hypothetical protein
MLLSRDPVDLAHGTVLSTEDTAAHLGTVGSRTSQWKCTFCTFCRARRLWHAGPQKAPPLHQGCAAASAACCACCSTASASMLRKGVTPTPAPTSSTCRFELGFGYGSVLVIMLWDNLSPAMCR